MIKFDYSGKHILVVGATGELGKDITQKLIDSDAKVTVVARNDEKLKLLFADNSSVNCIVSEFNTLEKVKELLLQVLDGFGKINGFVYAAGIERTEPVSILSEESLNDVFNVNLYSIFYFMKFLSKKKFHEPGFSSVLLSSIMGVVGQPGISTYCASKGAINNMVKSLSLELAKNSNRINAVCPAVVKTPMADHLFESIPEASKQEILNRHPLGLGLPDDVSSSVLFLLSENAKWITGTSLIVDGGYSAQ